METRGILVMCLALLAGAAAAPAEHQLVPGKLRTSWVGNTHEGAGPNGSGRWVQNFIDEAEITPDGAVITCSHWDEAGRCAGIYKDGDVNRGLLKQYNGKGGHKAWGWGTASRAVAVEGAVIFLANNKGDLMRFRWDPSNIHTYTYLDQVKASDVVGMTARDGTLYTIHESGEIQVRNAAAPGQTRTRFTVNGATDLAVDPTGTLWVLAGDTIDGYAADGTRLRRRIPDPGKPVAVSVDNEGRLVVCDNGPRQQVLFYDVTRGPRLARTFGDRGGLRSGTPGVITPRKLFHLRAAGTDADGNVYVALSSKFSIIRKYTRSGELVWEQASYPFVDQFDFYAPSDGREIYGMQEIFEMDYGEPSGKEWHIKAVTYDPCASHDGDGGGHGQATCIIRRLEGRRVIYGIGMHPGGFTFYVFEGPNSHITRHAGHIGGKKGGWAWDVDTRGDIWQGQAPGRKIRRYAFGGFDDAGNPVYRVDEPTEYAWPEPFTHVRRVRYIPERDVMYVFGDVPGKKPNSWGLVGAVCARYERWGEGNRTAKYVIDLPMDNDKLHPKAVDVAGEYVFAVAVKTTGRKPAMVHVYKADNGSKVGVMYPGKEVGGASGWVDIPYGIRAFQRSTGEYLVLVEEDWRAKNILYRWTPPGSPRPTWRRLDAGADRLRELARRR